jgi:hypothetical protein
VNSCGTSSYRTFALNRANPSNPGLISGPTNVCQNIGANGTPATYSVPAVSGLSYVWNLPAGSTGVSYSNGGASVSFVYPDGYTGGNIGVYAENGCGISQNRTLRVNPLQPAAPGVISVTPISSECSQRVYQYTIPPAAYGNYVWTVPNNGTITSGQGTNSITVEYGSSSIAGQVTVAIVSGCGSSSVRKLNVKLSVCAPSEYVHNDSELDVEIYPNPTRSSAQIDVQTISASKIVLRIMNVQGGLVKQMNMTPGVSKYIGSELLPGIYLFEVIQGNKRVVKKFIKL